MEEAAVLALIELSKLAFSYITIKMKEAGLTEDQIHEAFLASSAKFDSQDPSNIPR